MSDNRIGAKRAKLKKTPSRRRIIQAMGAGVAVSIAGCSGDGGGGDGGDGEDGDPAEELPEVELLNEDGEQATMTIFFEQGDEDGENISSQYKSDLERIGINLELEGRANLLSEDFASEPLEDANPEEFEFGPIARNAGPPDKTKTVADWDLLVGIAANTYPRTPGNTDVFWIKDSAVNAYGYVPENNHKELYQEFKNTTDSERRQEIMDTIMGSLTDEIPAVFSHMSKDYFGIRDDIHVAEERFFEYGSDLPTITRYREEGTASGDYIRLATTPMGNVVIPETDDNNSAMRHGLVADGTWTVDNNDEIVPLLMGIEDSGDSQVWVCTLRDNLQFGEDKDGNSYGQMTAEDWVFQLNNVHDVSGNAADMWDEETPPSAQTDSFSVVENVEQTGELEFQLELADADPLFPFRPIMWGEQCLPKALYEQYMPAAEAFRQAPELRDFTWTGNLGPYQFESWTPGETGAFNATRNDDYYMRDHTSGSNVQDMDEAWANAPYFELYRFDNEAEESTANERFRSGEGDQYGLPTSIIQEFQQEHDSVNVYDQRQPYMAMTFVNQRSNAHPICRDIKGREAISLVVDKEVITGQILRGFAEPAVTFQPQWSQWYNEDAVTVYGIDITEDDIVQARDNLRELDGFTLEEV